jgi:PAS domain S-box-containing protein
MRNGTARSKKNKMGRLRPPRTDGWHRKASSRPHELHGKQLDHVTQRYADLYDFAPTGYVSFDRSGRIEEINLTAAQLFGMPRQRLIGMPFMVFVASQDSALFLHHLLRCRCSETRVETEMRLKDVWRRTIDACLSSIAIAPSVRNGAVLYQTAIIDLTERKRAEKAQAEAARQQKALYELAQRQQEAKTSDEIYKAALDAILSALPCDRASILLYDQQQALRFVAWHGLSEKYRRAMEGHWPWKPNVKNPQPVCIADVDAADIPKSLKSTIRSEGICAAGVIPLVSKGTLIGEFMTYYNTPHRFTDDELKLAITIARQLAQAIQQKRDEDVLREKEAELDSLVTQTPFMLTRCTRDLRYRYVSRAYAELVGRKPEEIAGKPIVEIMGKEGLETILPHVNKVLKGRVVEYEAKMPFRGIEARWLHCVYTPDRDLDGNVIGWFASITDISRRKEAEEALRQSKESLEQRVRERTRELRTLNEALEKEIERRKGLEGEILEVSDREQQRLAQELHDGLCQHLTAVAFMARSVALRLKNHRVIEVGDIEKIAELVNNAATDTRNLSRALHRIDVDAPGLVGALQDLVDREMWRTPCRLEVKPSFHIEDDAAAAHLYRIAREAVINANKHAHASQIVVKLERSRRGGLILSVTDDGVGIHQTENGTRGLGFHIMDYRARLMGGQLKIESPKKGGTRVTCYLPQPARRSHKKGDGRAAGFSAKLRNTLTALI